MNITPFLIYVWQLADSIRCLLIVMTVMAGINIIVRGIVCIHAWIEDNKKLLEACSPLKLWAWFLLFALMVPSVLMPSSKTIAMMYVLPRIDKVLPNAETMSKEATEIYGMFKDYLAKELKGEER